MIGALMGINDGWRQWKGIQLGSFFFMLCCSEALSRHLSSTLLLFDFLATSATKDVSLPQMAFS